ncbi:velvet factor-domain-containing protein [Jimgerdemannia flammicorona]|uniref:Velvet factor-domain-containing protein n=1 Tax=Jimgerdemannia flammicorona TaxID=994334 RepID=A0A433QGZ9_9FUNG|nr:velvet factor-domain-containing protein [Jimgerdemannia flammicorona]
MSLSSSDSSNIKYSYTHLSQRAPHHHSGHISAYREYPMSPNPPPTLPMYDPGPYPTAYPGHGFPTEDYYHTGAVPGIGGGGYTPRSSFDMYGASGPSSPPLQTALLVAEDTSQTPYPNSHDHHEPLAKRAKLSASSTPTLGSSSLPSSSSGSPPSVTENGLSPNGISNNNIKQPRRSPPLLSATSKTNGNGVTNNSINNTSPKEKFSRREKVEAMMGPPPPGPPPPLRRPEPEDDKRSYQLQVCQQPLHARMCGFGEKDRRPIDPPPIVQLIIKDDKGNFDTNMLQNPFFVLHVTLWSDDGTDERNIISNPPKCTRVLMGSLVSSPSLLKNPEGEQGLYFAFPDLSIRTEGRYTLKFSLMKLGSNDFLADTRSIIITQAFSHPFTVYSAKKFPGMTESTELSKTFARQGLKIPIRNDVRPKKPTDLT